MNVWQVGRRLLLLYLSPAPCDSFEQEISQSRVYVPQKQDVGRILKLECIPISQNGLYTGN